MMKRANKNVTLTMEYFEDPIFFFIEHVLPPQLFIHIYTQMVEALSPKDKRNK